MKPLNAWIARWLCGVSLAAITSPAGAQTPEGLMKQDAATSGKTDVAKGGFETTAKPAEARETTALKLSAGGMMATGNSRNLSLTGVGQLRLRRAENQYSADIAGNYGRAATAANEPMETSVENVQGRIRYDRFLSPKWSLFVAQSARKDRFQGLALRLNFDPGVAYYVFEVDKHRLWAELGYDLQYDIRDERFLLAATEPITKTETRHSVRAFAGYENDLNEAVRFHTGLEYIQAIVDTENWRLNWDVGLTSSISTNFSLASTFSLRYDHNPLPGVRNTDTTTALSLVYTLL
jgi:putative salt-induced outer membrane protein